MKKRYFLQLLISVICFNSFGQTDGAVCCAVISIDAVKGTVTVRDKTTGELSQFKADAMDLRGIQKGDAVSVSAGKVNSINGATRMYATVQPDYGAVCCAIVSIQADPGAVCCAIVAIANNSTNQTYNIQVPK